MAGLFTDPLRAIDLWAQMISTNITDINMPGFKLRRIRLSDSVVDIDRLPEPTIESLLQGGKVSRQFPRATLNVTGTPIDFTQGSVEKTGIESHFAIKDRPGSPGSNFFLLSKDFDVSGRTERFVAFVSRDGEFHWTDKIPDSAVASQTGTQLPVPNLRYFDRGAGPTIFLRGVPPGPYLVNSYGLYVLAAREFSAQSSETYRIFSFLPYGFLFPPPEYKIGLPPGVEPAPIHPVVVNVKFPQNLEYSEYGSNIFIFKQRNADGTVVRDDSAAAAASLPIASDGYRYYSAPIASPSTPGNVDRRANVYADVERAALERANYGLMPLFPEMSTVQKTFVSISKVITVLTQNMDAILATTR